MKKTTLSATILILFFSFVSTGRAVSGVCSSHDGVNYYAGFDEKDGSVICNDGWDESTGKYWDMKNFDPDDIILRDFTKQERIVPGKYPDYDTEYNSCMAGRYPDLNIIDRMNACIRAASASSSIMSCPVNSIGWTKLSNKQNYCVCSTNFHDKNGQCVAGKVANLDDALKNGIDDFYKKLDKILPPKPPPAPLPTPKPNTPKPAPTPAPKTLLPAENKEEVKPEQDKDKLSVVKGTAVTQTPEKKPSLWNRIINFFKRLFNLAGKNK